MLVVVVGAFVTGWHFYENLKSAHSSNVVETAASACRDRLAARSCVPKSRLSKSDTHHNDSGLSLSCDANADGSFTVSTLGRNDRRGGVGADVDVTCTCQERRGKIEVACPQR